MRMWLILLAALLIAFVSEAALAASPLEEGIKFFKAGKYQEAKEAFDQGQIHKSTDSNALYYYALTAQQLRDAATARAYFQFIVNKHPDSPAAIYARQALGLHAVPAKKTTAIASATSIPSSQSSPANKQSAEGRLPPEFPLSLYPGASNLSCRKEWNIASARERSGDVKTADVVEFYVRASSVTNGESPTGRQIVNFYKKEFASKGWLFYPEPDNILNSDGSGLFNFLKLPCSAFLDVNVPENDKIKVELEVRYNADPGFYDYLTKGPTRPR